MTKELSSQLKGLAILMVVWVHIQAFFPSTWWQGRDGLALALVVLDQVSRLSVPLFIFLSWYGLAKKYGSRPAPVSLLFHTASKLIPLYLLWSGLMLVLMERVPQWKYAVDLLWWQKLFLGQADYQLYFVPLILMMYAGYVLASRLSPSALKKGTWVVAAITAGWYLVLPSWLTWYRGQDLPLYPDQAQYLVPLTWLWYAWLGLLAGQSVLFKKSSWFVKAVLPILAIGALGWSIYDAWVQITNGGSVLLATMFTRIPVLVTVTLVLGTILTWQQALNRWQWPWLASLGVGSYVIYLVHTQGIRLVLSQWQAPVPAGDWLLGLGVVLIFLFVALFGDKVASRFSSR